MSAHASRRAVSISARHSADGKICMPVSRFWMPRTADMPVPCVNAVLAALFSLSPVMRDLPQPEEVAVA
jgi:hypothetical protein